MLYQAQQRKPMVPQQKGGAMSGANSSMARGGGVAARPPQGAGIDGAIQQQMQSFLTGGMQKPQGMAIPPQRLQAMNAPPAWKQLQGMGVAGQGSAQANRAKLQEMLAQQGGPQMAGGVATAAPGGPQSGGIIAQQGAMTGPEQSVLEKGQAQAQMANGSAPVTPSFGGADPAIHQRLLQQSFGGGGNFATPYGGMR